MAFEIVFRVVDNPDGTYDVCVHSGRGVVMKNREEVEMCIAIMQALRPLLNDDFKKKQRVPIPRHLSLVVANDLAA